MVPQLLIHPDLIKRKEYVQKILEKHNVSLNHPNLLWFEDNDKVGIEQIRKIQQHISLKPYQQNVQISVIISAHSLSQEAQNALLKILEEPPQSALLILGASSDNNFLPTLLSRCHLIYISQETITTDAKKIQKYRQIIENIPNLSFEERFQIIEKMNDKEEFFHYMLVILHDMLHAQLIKNGQGRRSMKLHTFLKELILTQKWHNQNVNTRAILEYLMLKFPS